MARALRVQIEGAIYHVTSRGNERRAIFRTDADRNHFCETLGENIEAHYIRLYAYVLMDNHYIHLNPVEIKRMQSLPIEEKQKQLRTYAWSSYRAYAGLRKKEEWVDYAPLSELIARGRTKRETRYRQYVESGL
ncbi:MAG: transposase, partial [Verrucomicrobia bacterium]|nr:transposase [Verrucomicrobiota bacterium]